MKVINVLRRKLTKTTPGKWFRELTGNFSILIYHTYYGHSFSTSISHFSSPFPPTQTSLLSECHCIHLFLHGFQMISLWLYKSHISYVKVGTVLKYALVQGWDTEHLHTPSSQMDSPSVSPCFWKVPKKLKILETQASHKLTYLLGHVTPFWFRKRGWQPTGHGPDLASCLLLWGLWGKNCLP